MVDPVPYLQDCQESLKLRVCHFLPSVQHVLAVKVPKMRELIRSRSGLEVKS